MQTPMTMNHDFLTSINKRSQSSMSGRNSAAAGLNYKKFVGKTRKNVQTPKIRTNRIELNSITPEK